MDFKKEEKRGILDKWLTFYGLLITIVICNAIVEIAQAIFR